MSLKCMNCGRMLKKFAASIPTDQGDIGWGPTCARKVLVGARKRARAMHKASRPVVAVDERQLVLELA